MSRLATSIYCPYCFRHTSLQVAPVEYQDQYETRHVVGAVWKVTSHDYWWIGICNNCQLPVLVLNDGQVVYPAPLPTPTDPNVPELIRSDLNEAKKCFGVSAWRASAAMARRALQSAALDKGAAVGGKLVDQIDELTMRGVITADLKEWASVVRWVGNDAAHPGGDPVTEGDAEAILKLAEQFLHVVYVAPAVAKALRAKKGK